jgi:hypothetical protein
MVQERKLDYMEGSFWNNSDIVFPDLKSDLESAESEHKSGYTVPRN